MRSSLTCPLVANGVPVGFIFFSSVEPHAYADVHVEIFQRIAEQLSVMVERGRLVSALVDQKAVLEQQNEELRRLHDQQNIFLGMAAHDLRNPIGAIQMLAAILNTPEAPVSEDRRKQFIQRIYGQAANMLALLDDILDVSQIESGTFTLAPVPLDLGAALDEAVQHHDVLARSKGTSVRLHAVPPALVRADPLRLRQVLDNLISNAVKFSPPGSVVTVGARPHDRMWRVAVRDQGPGITRDDQEKLFTAFSRLSARPTGGERSTGLGLAITRQVVLAHGGQIGVKSTPGQGATFWFTLPASLPAHATG